MVVTSPKKRVDTNIQHIERKDYIKYLGVFIDKHLNWGPRHVIQHVNNRVRCKKHWHNKQTQMLYRPKNNEAVILYINFSLPYFYMAF